jgi:hypothetical protein
VSETHKVLPHFLRIRITSVDVYGNLGRDLHPQPSQIGQGGIILAGLLDGRKPAQPGWEVEVEDNDEDVVVYIVLLDDGSILEMMWFEIEPE